MVSRNLKYIIVIGLILSTLTLASCSSAPEPTPSPTIPEKTKVTAVGSFNCEGDCDPNQLEASFYLEGGRIEGTGQLLVPEDNILWEVSFVARSYPDGRFEGTLLCVASEMTYGFDFEGEFADGVVEATVTNDNPNNSLIVPPSFTLEY